MSRSKIYPSPCPNEHTIDRSRAVTAAPRHRVAPNLPAINRMLMHDLGMNGKKRRASLD